MISTNIHTKKLARYKAFTIAEPRGGIELCTNKVKKAFTLAEVLITLAVIGVVAAVSIPSLQTNINDSKFKTAYRKAFSDMSTAYNSAKLNMELTPLSAHTDVASMKANMIALSKYFSVTKTCDGMELPDCWDVTGEQFRGGMPGQTATSYSFIDNSGRSWTFRNIDSAISYIILVDTNGFKGPNVYGKDRFPMMLAYQNHLDNPDLNWNSAEYHTNIGIPIKVHPFEDMPQYAYDYNGAYVCGSASYCYYKTWLMD